MTELVGVWFAVSVLSWGWKVSVFLLTWLGLALLCGPAMGAASMTGDGEDVIKPEDVMRTLDRLEHADKVSP